MINIEIPQKPAHALITQGVPEPPALNVGGGACFQSKDCATCPQAMWQHWTPT
jgi:hypothetical protein